jgi:hypothetical protein
MNEVYGETAELAAFPPVIRCYRRYVSLTARVN